MEIIIKAETFRASIWVPVALCLFALIIDLFFIRLAYSHFKSQGLSATIFGFLFICLIFTSWAFVEAYAYVNTQDLRIGLNENFLNISLGPSKIPISRVNAKIDQVTDINADIITDQNVGHGLIIEVPQLDQYLNLKLANTRSTVFKIKDQIQLLIGKQISEEDALAFVNFIQANKK
jgi:hypothetical protein